MRFCTLATKRLGRKQGAPGPPIRGRAVRPLGHRPLGSRVTGSHVPGVVCQGHPHRALLRVAALGEACPMEAGPSVPSAKMPSQCVRLGIARSPRNRRSRAGATAGLATRAERMAGPVQPGCREGVPSCRSDRLIGSGCRPVSACPVGHPHDSLAVWPAFMCLRMWPQFVCSTTPSSFLAYRRLLDAHRADSWPFFVPRRQPGV